MPLRIGFGGMGGCAEIPSPIFFLDRSSRLEDLRNRLKGRKPFSKMFCLLATLPAGTPRGVFSAFTLRLSCMAFCLVRRSSAKALRSCIVPVLASRVCCECKSRIQSSASPGRAPLVVSLGAAVSSIGEVIATPMFSALTLTLLVGIGGASAAAKGFASASIAWERRKFSSNICV